MDAAFLEGLPAVPSPFPNAELTAPRRRIAPAGGDPTGLGPPEDDAEAELGVWSSGSLVAIVRRRGGRTVEVLRVAGED